MAIGRRVLVGQALFQRWQLATALIALHVLVVDPDFVILEIAGQLRSALGLEQSLASARQSGAEECDARVDMSGMKDDLRRRRGVYPNALDDHTIAQRCLRPKPHQPHPDFRPALIRAVGCDAKRPSFPPRCYSELPIAVRPPPPKSLATAPEKPD